MASAFRSPSVERASRLLGVLAIASAIAAASYLLLPSPLADVFFAAWVLGSVVVSLVGGLAAWTNRTRLVWVAALLLTGLSVAGMWSVGLFVAPAAALLLSCALLLQWSGPRTDVRAPIAAEPPTVREVVLKALAGVGSAVGGGWLAYEAAVERDLFGACAAETVACVLDATRWTAVGTTVFGLIAISLGGWMLWRQAYAARVLASME